MNDITFYLIYYNKRYHTLTERDNRRRRHGAL